MIVIAGCCWISVVTASVVMVLLGWPEAESSTVGLNVGVLGRTCDATSYDHKIKSLALASATGAGLVLWDFLPWLLSVVYVQNTCWR